MLIKIKRKALDLGISVGAIGSVHDLPDGIALFLIEKERADKFEVEKKPEVHTTVISESRTRPVKRRTVKKK